MSNVNDTGTYQGTAVKIEKVNANGTLDLVATAPSTSPQRFLGVEPSQFTATNPSAL